MPSQDYTEIRFNSIQSNRVQIYIDGNLATLNTWYDKNLTIEIRNDNDLEGSPLDYITYQVKNADGLISNTSVITVNKPVQGSPIAQNNEITINNSQIIIPIDSMGISGADRIRIVSFDNYGELSFDGSYLYPNQEIFLYDKDLLLFESDQYGIGNPYNEIFFQVGNQNGYNPSTYSLKINIDGLAYLDLSQDQEVTIPVPEDNTQDYYARESVIRVYNTFGGKDVKFNFRINLPAGVFDDPNDGLIINFGSQDITITDESFNQDFIFSASENGFDDISITMRTLISNAPVSGTIEVELISINNDVSLVDNSNKLITLNISI